MFSDAAVHMLRAAKANPAATAMACTALGVYTVRMHYMKRTLAQLEHNNRELSAALKDRKDGISQRLQQLEDVVKRDLAARDAFIRRMELQNVEQTRSVDRLQHTLRSCSTTGAATAAAMGSATLQQHQQQATQTNSPATATSSTSTTTIIDPSVVVPHLSEDIVAPAEKRVVAAAVVSDAADALPTTDASSSSPAVSSSSSTVSEQQQKEFVVVQEIDRLEQLRSRIVQNNGVDNIHVTSISATPTTTTVADVAVPAAEIAPVGSAAEASGESK